MPNTIIRQGSVTITVSQDIAAFARRAAELASRGALRVLEEAANEVAVDARQRWYQLVDKRTGLTGEIDVVTRISSDEVRVGVGSTDGRRSKLGKPIPVFVRQPSSSSTKMVNIGPKEWGRRKRAGQIVSDIIGWAPVLNPKRAASPAYLLQLLVKQPMRARLKAALPRLRREMLGE